MRKILIIFFLILIPLNLFSKNIVTSIYPVYDIIKNITPDNFKISYVIPPNANPHIFEPTPKTAILIKKADIFIGIEKDFDGWVEKFLSKNCKIVYLINNRANPHIWLSPVIMLKKIKFLSDYLCKQDQDNCQIIKLKSLKYSELLLKEYKCLQKKIEKIKYKNCIQYHPAWYYFAKDFHLDIVGTFTKEHGVNISLKHYMNLLDAAKKNNVKFVITGFNCDNKILKNFSKKVGCKIINLNLFGNKKMNYLKLIKYNVDKITDSLN